LKHFFSVYYGSAFKKINLSKDNKIIIEMSRDDTKFSTGEMNLLREYILLQNFKCSQIDYLILDDPISSFDNVNMHFLINEINCVIDDLLDNENNTKKIVIMTHDFYSFLKLNNYIYLKKDKNKDVTSIVLDKINEQLRQFSFNPK